MFEAQQALIRRGNDEGKKAKRLAFNAWKRKNDYVTTLPDGSKVDPDLIQDQFNIDMMEQYASWYDKYVTSTVSLQKEGRQKHGVAQTSEEGKKKVSEETIEFIKEQTAARKELINLPTPDEFNKLSTEEKAIHYNKLSNYNKNYDYTNPTARKWKADAEVVRSRLINSPNIPLAVRKYLAKSDLQTAMDYLAFMDKAKNNIGKDFKDSNQAVDLWYAEQYDDVPSFAKTEGQRILYNFLKDQISRHDVEYANKVINKAAQIKVKGRHVFTLDDLKGYLKK